MAAKMARSSYKSTTGQSQKPHDDSMAHWLNKILHSLDEVNYDPSSFTFNDDEDNNHESLASPTGKIPKPAKSRQAGSSDVLKSFLSPSRT
jgi:hypothetical protein